MKRHNISECACDSLEANCGLLSVGAAREIALNLVKPVLGFVLVPLIEALGRVSSKPLYAPAAMPFFDNSAMDGYAISVSHLKEKGPWKLTVGATITAGDDISQVNNLEPSREAVRIFTGAPVPDGFDAVIPQENCFVENGLLHLETRPKNGTNVRYAGSDIARGAILIEAGTRITARHVGLLAANGYGAINVRKRPKIAIFSTGDELVKPGENTKPGQIYDCNRPMLTALISEMGLAIDDLGALPDDQTATRKLIESCRSDYDFVLSTGSVSVGERDYLKSAFVEAGGVIKNWKVAVKPGKPILLGNLGDAIFTGLPGNPFAAYVGFCLFVKPQLLQLSGICEKAQAPIKAMADFDWKRKPGRTEFFPVTQSGITETGLPQIVRLGQSVSATLFPLVFADGLAEVPEDCDEVSRGDMIDWQPFCN